MKTVTKLILGAITVHTMSCTEIYPLIPPKESPTISKLICVSPPVEKNIVGTWNFNSTLNPKSSVELGTVTFKSDKKVIDPDSLFENHLDLGPVISKTYSVINDTTVSYGPANDPTKVYKGSMVKVYEFIKQSSSSMRLGQTYLLVVTTNECDKIQLTLLGSANNRTRIVLTR